MLLASLHACGFGASEPQETLVGVWLMTEDGSSFPLNCASGRPMHYYVDGTFRLFSGAGTWRLEGKVLTESPTFVDPMHLDSEGVEIGRSFVSTIEWIDPDRFHKKYRDGDVREFRRCPDAQ